MVSSYTKRLVILQILTIERPCLSATLAILAIWVKSDPVRGPYRPFWLLPGVITFKMVFVASTAVLARFTGMPPM